MATSTSRRIPPPCWSDDETVALIDVYRAKWYSLRRGNLRAPDWQEVADGVAARCTLANPPKTSIQCRHKMEKLRKRYRSEIQRIGNRNRNRQPSSWVHFKLMESMELGLTSSDRIVNSSNQNDEEEDEDEEDLTLNHNFRYQPSIATEGVRIKIPNFAFRGSNNNDNRFGDDLPPSLNKQYGLGWNGVKRKDDGGNVMNEMVAAIQRLGDGFVKMERMKMDMVREVESMRMKTEMEQTEMILETHQKLWDSLTETVNEKKNKKVKRMETTEGV